MTGPLAPPLDLVTTALLELLRGAGRPVYDGAYTGDPARPPYWYSILYALPGGSSDPMPTLDDRGDEATLAYQVSTVSNLRNQAERGASILRGHLLGRAFGTWAEPLPLPPGWTCIARRPDPAMPGVLRDGDPPNAVFTVPARYLLTVAPA